MTATIFRCRHLREGAASLREILRCLVPRKNPCDSLDLAPRFETRRARLAGRFPELEEQLCALPWTGYEGPGSPDRADAMVWAMTELFAKGRAEPRIRML